MTTNDQILAALNDRIYIAGNNGKHEAQAALIECLERVRQIIEASQKPREHICEAARERKIHNPENVPDGCLPRGNRFLFEDEIQACEVTVRRLLIWNFGGWVDRQFGNNPKMTYCTALTPEQLEEARK